MAIDFPKVVSMNKPNSKKNQPRILVYASHPILAALTQFRLRLLELSPVVVTNEQEWQAEILHSLPSLVIIDLELSSGMALSLIEQLACNEVTSRIPVLCMSSEGDLSTAEKAFQAGASDFLVVPFDPILLENKVRQLLSKPEQRLAASSNRKSLTVAGSR